MKKKVLKKIIVALCAATMSIPTAASVGAMYNGGANNANHQQQNTISEAKVNCAKTSIQNFFNEINQKTMSMSDYSNLDNELIATSESLSKLNNALDNINNLDFDDLMVTPEGVNAALKDFNRYMINYGNWGPISKEKLENIKEKSDTIQHIFNGENPDYI